MNSKTTHDEAIVSELKADVKVPSFRRSLAKLCTKGHWPLGDTAILEGSIQGRRWHDSVA